MYGTAIVGFVGLVAVAATNAGDTALSTAEALLLGVVEGLTEFLPVSSTGHLTVTQRLLGLSDTEAGKDAADSYVIAVQFGAIVAVAGLYRKRIAGTARHVLRPPPGEETEAARRLLVALLVAFTPAAIVGLLVGDLIKTHLFGVAPTAVAWFVGGVAVLWFASRHQPGVRALEAITAHDGLVIGAVQVLALWPGVSRSLVTIIAAAFLGLAMDAAVEFSFLLGLAILSAATIYETITNGGLIVNQFGLMTPLLGLLAAFFSAAVAVVWMVRYLQGHSLAVFGYYRIAVAALVGVGLLLS